MQGRDTVGVIGLQGKYFSLKDGSRRKDTKGAIESREEDTEGAAGSRGGDTGGVTGSRAGDMELSSDRKEKTREAPSDPDEETQEAPLDTGETQKAPPNPEKETREGPSNPGVETKYVAGLEERPTDLEGLVVPARRELTISGNLLPSNVKAHVESTGARERERGSAAKFSADERGRRRGECVNVRRQGHNDCSEKGGATGADSIGHVTRALNWQQAMNTLEMEEWRKIRRKKKCKVARPNGNLVVRARVIYNRNRLTMTERSRSTDICRFTT